MMNEGEKPGIDMSPEAIKKRLLQVAALYELNRKLKTAKKKKAADANGPSRK